MYVVVMRTASISSVRRWRVRVIRTPPAQVGSTALRHPRDARQWIAGRVSARPCGVDAGNACSRDGGVTVVQVGPQTGRRVESAAEGPRPALRDADPTIEGHGGPCDRGPGGRCGPAVPWSCHVVERPACPRQLRVPVLRRHLVPVPASRAMTRDLTDLRTHPGQPSCRGVRITLNWS